MASIKKIPTLDDLLEAGEWELARQRLERELGYDPLNHWLLTQIGVTYYECKQYRKSLTWFMKAYKIVPDCPLTLWNIAGALDALRKHALAVKIYSWLLDSKRTSDDDPCWESDEWTDSLKADASIGSGDVSCILIAPTPPTTVSAATSICCWQEFREPILWMMRRARFIGSGAMASSDPF